MRWRRAKFALFAVVGAAAGLAAPVGPGQAAVPAETQTILLWRDQEEKLQPDGPTTFYVSVANVDGTTRPTGSVVVTFDGQDRPAMPLAREDPEDEQAKITDDFEIDLGTGPHYLITRYTADDTASFAASDDELGLATAELRADPEPSQEGVLVKYTFDMNIAAATPANRRPDGRVAFRDDDNHASQAPHQQISEPDLKAEWNVGQRQGRWRTEAVYSRGTDFFQPVRKVREHNVDPPPTPSGGTAPRPTPTTRRVTPTTARRTGTTVALAPINPTTSTSLVDQGTASSISETFPSNPDATSDVAASGFNTKKDDGPPLVVVVTTLLALGVLGGVAAVRRYRRSAIDWL